MSQALSFPTPGALTGADGTRFHVWAPDRTQVEVALFSAHDASHPDRVVPLERDADGFHSGLDPAGRAGDLYKYRLDGADAQTFPDPASRRQPHGVHGQLAGWGRKAEQSPYLALTTTRCRPLWLLLSS